MIYKNFKIAIIFLILLLFANDSHAYIDPGAGSFFFQLIIAFLVGGLFAIKLFWGRILDFLRKVFAKKK